MKQKVLSFLVLMLCCRSTIMAGSASGTCGTNATWTYDGTTVTISGTGSVTGYDWVYSINKDSDSKIIPYKVVINEGITSLECTNSTTHTAFGRVTSITIPKSLTDMGNYTFYGNTVLTDVIIKGIPNIGADVFYGCSNLKSISVQSFKSVGAGAFCNCTSLSGKFIIDGSIGQSAFKNCTRLDSIIVKGGSSIDKHAFYNCTNLKYISIANSVTTIGEYAFYYNDTLI